MASGPALRTEDAMAGWTTLQMPAQDGRTALVTGATGGIGYEAALALAGKGARVIVAARNPAKGEAALAAIRAAHPKADVRFEPLDLTSLASVAACAERVSAAEPRLDLLINNAGVMTPPKRLETTDGFELQFGVNHLAHFALTLRLLALARRGERPRVVTVSSGAHHAGRIDFDDLQWTKRRYSPWQAYGQSKLANILFALELQRRSDLGGWGVMSNACHPGYARTDLIANGPGLTSPFARLSVLLAPLMSQSAADGALPTLYAATSPEAEGGGYYGPSRRFELVGPPGPARLSAAARQAGAAQRLWTVSETLTGVAA
jgi:NAD(P)-dependent dehydrogenase (short-subunit alcohol dehydrogenase family)